MEQTHQCTLERTKSSKVGLPRCKNLGNFFFVLLTFGRVRLLFDVFFFFFTLLFSFVSRHL